MDRGAKESDTTERLHFLSFLTLFFSETIWMYNLEASSFNINIFGEYFQITFGLPRWQSGESFCQCWRCGFDPWVRQICWRRKWQSTPVFFPGKFHGQRSLVGYSARSCKELDMAEWLKTHTRLIQNSFFSVAGEKFGHNMTHNN